MTDNGEPLNIPKPCIGCGRPTLWRYGHECTPLCGRNTCGSGPRKQELLDDWEKKRRARLDAAIAARASHITGKGGSK